MMSENERLLCGIFFISLWSYTLSFPYLTYPEPSNSWPYRQVNPRSLVYREVVVNHPNQPVIRAEPRAYSDAQQNEHRETRALAPRSRSNNSPSRGNFQVYTGAQDRSYNYRQQGREPAYGGHGPYFKPYDLTIPSYAYIPERYTGAMQYLPNPYIYAAYPPGGYIRDWNNFTGNFRETDIPATPAYDSLWQNMIAYIDGHPLTQSTSTTTIPTTTTDTTTPAPSSQLLRLSLAALSKSKRFRPCASRRNGNRFGLCIDDSAVTQLCVGKSVGKSIICARTESCCLDMDENDLQLPGSGVIAFKPCGTLLSGGVLAYGVCVNDDRLGDLCSDKSVAQSDSCDIGQSCCSDEQGNGFRARRVTPRVVAVPQLETTTDTPIVTSLPATVNGAGASSFMARFRPCIPNWNTPQFGICVNDQQLSTVCIDQVISKSPNCPFSESCCVDASGANRPPPQQTIQTTESPIEANFLDLFTRAPPVIRRPQSGILRRRNRNNRPRTVPPRQSLSCSAGQSKALGTCVVDISVADQCSGQAVFRSPDCPSEQACCIPISSADSSPNLNNFPAVTTDVVSSAIGSDRPPQSTFIPCISAENDQSIGICVDKPLVASLCVQRLVSQSTTCLERQSCCTEMPSTDSSAENPNPQPSLDMVLTSSSTFRTCATSGAPLFQRGICVQDNFVTRLCAGQFIGKSSDCQDVQTCCVGDAIVKVALQARANQLATESTTVPTTTTPAPNFPAAAAAAALVPGNFVWPQIFQQCIPIVNNFQLGVCVNENQVQSLCTGRLVAPSRSCALAQSCCSYFFDSADGMEMRASRTTATTSTTTSTAAPVFIPPPPPPSVSVTETNSESGQNVFHPCAAVGGIVGVCVSQNSAMTYCLGKLIAVSGDCERSQLCCYDMAK